ncbi:MAG TPA: sodium:solute symporter family protein [Candidatus Acidoferrales bacterium]|nr:sodium:solute symporter family protein [Candidatus Acidoferrales bacterium]
MTPSWHLRVFLAITGLYVVVVCAIGLWTYRKTKDEAGFLVAGRSLGPIVGGATLMANQISAGTTIGVVGFHYFSGISFLWTWTSVWFGWLIAAILVAPKMREMAGITLPDYFAARFESLALRGVSAILIMVAYAVMLSAQYQAGGLLISMITRMSYSQAVILVAATVAVYTTLGGMYSNAYVGMLKAVLLIGAYVTAVPFLLRSVGGLHALGYALHSIDSRLTGSWFTARHLFAISLAVGLGLACAPYEISAIYSLSSKRVTRLAIGYSFVFQAIIAVGVLIFGLSMRKLVPFLPDPDLATPVLGMSILPVWIGMLALLTVVVTFTRTGGAILLTIASALSHDIYVKFFRPQATEKEKVLAGRLSVLCFGIIPVIIALRRMDLVNFVVIFASQLLVSFFFAPVVIGLNWRRATREGALASMFGGATACLTWNRLAHPYFWGLDPVEAGLIVSILLLIMVSLVTEPASEHSLRIFFAPKNLPATYDNRAP